MIQEALILHLLLLAVVVVAAAILLLVSDVFLSFSWQVLAFHLMIFQKVFVSGL